MLTRVALARLGRVDVEAEPLRDRVREVVPREVDLAGEVRGPAVEDVDIRLVRPDVEQRDGPVGVLLVEGPAARSSNAFPTANESTSMIVGWSPRLVSSR